MNNHIEAKNKPDREACPSGNSNSNLCPAKIQLWQFLLELLVDQNNTKLIKWLSTNDGAFEFVQADEVARMWGQRKGFLSMNYSKLTRVLRNYYSLGLITKINNHQYAYKFMFDLKYIMGYSFKELNHLLEKKI